MVKKTNRIVLYAIVMAAVVGCAGCSSEDRLAGDSIDTLSAYDWQSYVADKTGIWVSVDRQEVLLIDNNRVAKRYRCSTAAAGVGNKVDSGKTPLGWHRVGAKVGGELEVGAVLKDREWTGRVWKEGQHADADLILSRILWLEGLEAGKNRGGNIDTWNRYIYIHGTNQTDDLGTPVSAGCVRLDPHEVIDLYERVKVGTPVLITRD
ncbi:MAG: L,D-transpeptidase [Planctomycetota bacterium]